MIGTVNTARFRPVIVSALTVLLTGCGVDMVKPDQAVKLQPGQGIAAVVIDTLDPLDSITIDSPDNSHAPSIVMESVQKGISLFVYKVPTGKYCVVSIHYGVWRITQKDPGNGACFEVTEGKVSYSGNIGPRVYGTEVRTAQAFDWKSFQEMLTHWYPNLSGIPVALP
ncbi:MAG: hypothetical protein ACM3ZT_05935 [Bacillota bacterium]